MANMNQASMVEVAFELLSQKKGPQHIMSLIKEVLEIKGLDDPNDELATQLYIDITTSSDFVFVGEGKWDLKSRHSLDVYDRDGSFYSVAEEDEDDDEEIGLDDYNVEDEDSDDDDDEDSDDDYEDDYNDSSFDKYDDPELADEDDDEQDYYDEEKYNDIMDDYEDMYDK